MTEFDNLTWLHGKPQGSGLLKANPEDFVVVEDLGFTPDGEGEHILLRILKNGCNTRFVADALAKFLKIHAREVSFAGQKDKHAVIGVWLEKSLSNDSFILILLVFLFFQVLMWPQVKPL